MTRPAPLFSPAFAADPHPTYAALRDHRPLLVDPGERMGIVTRYDDVSALLRSDAASAAGGQQQRRDDAGVPRSMLTTDGADHHRLRSPAALLLGPAAIGSTLALAQPVIEALWDQLSAAETVDLLADVAEPFATAVIGATFAVTDPDTLCQLGEHARAVSINLDPRPAPAQVAVGRAAMAACAPFLDSLLAAAPDGSPLRALVDDGRLSPEEVRGILSLVLVGGWGPLAEVFSSLVRVVLAEGYAARLADNPELASALLEDVLRWHTPIPFVARRTTAEVSLPSGVVPADTMVLGMLGSANRDPRAFDRPDEVSAGKPATPHLAFGAGAHFCMGAALIRGILPAALLALLERGIATDDANAAGADTITWEPITFPRRVASIPIRIGHQPRPSQVRTHERAVG